jgi:DNA-binding XRE family transcriptional regulator
VEFYQAMLRLQARRIRQLFGLVEDLNTLPLRSRLAKQLLHLVRSYGVPCLNNAQEIRIGLHLAQEELAQLLGASRQRVNQELKSMEREEAIQLLNVFNTNLTEAEMDYVFKNIGTNPVRLLQLVEELVYEVPSTMTLQDFIDDVIQFANMGIVPYPYKEILQALKDHPEGISPKYFNNRIHKSGVNLSDPVAVGIATMNCFHRSAVVYRVDLDKYVLASTALRTALQSYEIRS